ncbi:FAD-dependent oxidoreductase [Chondromyces crocatus]|nr:FAD-dependent oxidoreductase [Chondromyces crocatus]
MPITAPSLEESTTADVCIVGAGIAGLTAAYLLQRSGVSVVVLDRGPIGGGETAQTTAHLASAMDEGFEQLIRLFGHEGAQLAYESHASAIDTIEAITRGEGIECEFARVDGYLFLGAGQAPDLLDRELEAATRLGFPGVERLERAPLAAFDTGPCLRFPQQGMFHPLRYLAGLVAAVLRDGGRVFEGTPVTHVDGGESPTVWTRDGLHVRAKAVIVATNTPINDRFAIHTKQAPYRSYAVALPVPELGVPRGLYWDTEDPYHYARLHRVQREDGGFTEMVIVGGEDHKTGEADDAEERYARLEAWARARFPVSGEMIARWSGQVMEPVDGLGFIGADPGHSKNVYIATGDSGQGMTHGTIAGMLLSDLISGRENPWTSLYNPRRRTLRAVGEYARENLKVARHYAEWLGRAPLSTPDDIPRGGGSVVQRGIHKVAVYRDEEGSLHEVSAVCSHLGGVVHWNSEEKSWDCPCHGSRFSPTGEVLQGPAFEPLEEVREPGAGDEDQEPEAPEELQRKAS